MNKIRQILRMSHQGRSIMSITVQSGCSRNTVRKYISAFIHGDFRMELQGEYMRKKWNQEPSKNHS
ncbi:helix-turn-helix domain-containing protein [Pedobacter alpinus]|uniref:Helix-turn-helix domain-containing protein n=1 Tax=Pedobacter alpinus TaxID=1590643 RepID=A0ABW5TR14_9SPHI